MGIYFQADVVTKASLGSCHPFSSIAEFLNLILGFGSTTVDQDLQSHQLGVGGKRAKTAKRDNSVIFPHQVLNCHREIALFGACPPASLPVLAFWGRKRSTLCYKHPQKRVSVRTQYKVSTITWLLFVPEWYFNFFHTMSWSFAGPRQIIL